MNKWSLRGRVVAVVAAIAAFSFLSLQPNLASQSQQDYLDRQAYCLDLLLKDIDAHARECPSSPILGVPSSLSTPVPGAPPPVVVPDTYPCPIPGNTGGSNCLGSSNGHIAPFLADFFHQVALLVWPATDLKTDEAKAG
jgi:hypothetical protein